MPPPLETYLKLITVSKCLWIPGLTKGINRMRMGTCLEYSCSDKVMIIEYLLTLNILVRMPTGNCASFDLLGSLSRSNVWMKVDGVKNTRLALVS